MGDEEIPEKVVAVIAPDVTDLVSHVAVRARNAQVLFASCSDPPTLDHLKSLRGQQLRLEVTPAGDVWYEKAIAPATTAPARPRRTLAVVKPPKFTRYAVTMERIQRKDCRWKIMPSGAAPRPVAGVDLSSAFGGLAFWRV